MLGRFHTVVKQAPRPFTWLADAVSDRVPVLECAQFDDREYWSIRLAHRYIDRLVNPCFGFSGRNDVETSKVELAPPLAWAASTFGTINLVAEQSGSACFGRTLGEVAETDDHFAAEAVVDGDAVAAPHDFADIRRDLPRGADEWISLYEADGDWVFADVRLNQTVWVAAEWTGRPYQRIAVPWARAASFILWRLVDGGHVQPIELQMLAA